MTDFPSRRQNPAIPCNLALGAIIIVLLAVAARAVLQFSTPLAPGMNGAYYFVQARSLLEHGKLGIPDLPLTFWVHASLSRIFQGVTGWDQARSIVIAVKATDSVLPPLAALPLIWLGWNWQRNGDAPSMMAALAPALAAVLGAQALRMTGDFQKNSLGLIWLAALAPAAHSFLTQPSARRALLPLVLIGLLGITHVGVLGGALVFIGVLAAISSVSAPPTVRMQVLLFTLAGIVVMGCAGAITRTFDPNRFHRLTQAIVSPTNFAESQGGPGMAGNRPPRPQGQDFAPNQQPPFAPAGTDHPPRPGPGHPPDGHGFIGPPFAPGWGFITLGILGLVVSLWKRRHLPAADFALALAAGITCGLLGEPFMDEQKAERLMLIAVIPAAITVSFLLAQLSWPWLRHGLGVVIIGLTLISAQDYVRNGGRAILTTEAQAELRALSTLIPVPERTLIVARHGLEWWTAWTLHTHIAQPGAISTEDWQRYDQVLFLSENRVSDPLRDPAGYMRQAGHPLHAPQLAGRSPGGFPGGPGEAEVPMDARTLHAGKYYQLSLVPEPPENTPTDAEIAAHRLNRP